MQGGILGINPHQLLFLVAGKSSATDYSVLRFAISKGFQVPPNKFYLVDGGYVNTPSFLAPY
jgi:hypothetical protein